MMSDIIETKAIYRLIKKELFIYFVIFLIPFILFAPVILKDVNINSGDGVGYEIAQNFVRRVIFEGELPMWNKYIALGTSNVGDIQQKLFYPLTWVVLLFPEKIGFKFFYTLHISLAGVFSYKLCRQIECSECVSVFGAILFAFSNLVIIRYEHMNILCCFVWIPLIICFEIQYYKFTNSKYLILLAISMGIQFMAGFPQTAFYTDIFVVAFMVYLNFRMGKRGQTLIFDLIKLGSIYIALCMIQILPLIEIMKFAGRNEISYEYFSDGAANLLLLADMFAPDMTGIFGGFLSGTQEFPTDTYLGVIPLLLMIYAVIYLHKNKDVVFLLAYSLFALVFATACNNFPAIGKLIYKMPLLGSFRTTTRMLAFFIIPLMMIVVIALKDIIKNENWKKGLVISNVVLGIYIVFYIGVRILYNYRKSTILEYYIVNHTGLKPMVLIVLLNVGLIIHVVCKKKGKRTILLPIAAIVLQILDVYCINIDAVTTSWRLPYIMHARTYEDIFSADAQKYITSVNHNKDRVFVSFNTWDELANTPWAIRPNGNMLSQMPMIQSYITFNNPMLLKLANTSYGMMMNTEDLGMTTNQSIIDALNIKYVICSRLQQKLGTYEKDGIVYEEYDGRKLLNGTDIMLGDISSQSYYLIAIDATEIKESCLVCINDTNDNRVEIGSLNNEKEFYEFKYVPEKDAIVSIEFIGEDGIKLNGMRVERYSVVNTPALDEVYSDDHYVIWKNRQNSGHMFVLDKVRFVDSSEQYVLDNKNNIDFAHEGICDKSCGEEDISGGKGNVQSIVEKNNAVYANVCIESERAMVVFSESYYPGWDCYIDNKKTPIYRVDGLLQGVIIPNGEHEIEFRYFPKTVIVGGIISGLMLIIVLRLLIKNSRERKEKSK